MRYSAAEKDDIIRLVEQSSLPVKRTLARLDIRKSTFYGWLKRCQEDGVDALEDSKPYLLVLVFPHPPFGYMRTKTIF